MKAVILAAGQGSRAKKITNGLPKCFLTINGSTLIQKQIDALQSIGLTNDKIFVVFSQYDELFSKLPVKLIKNDDYITKDNSYSLLIAIQNIGFDEDILIMDSDLVFDESILKKVCTNGNIILSKETEDTEDSTGVEIDKNNRVIHMSKSVKGSGFIYCSIFKIDNNCVEKLYNNLLMGDMKTWYTDSLNKLFPIVDFNNVVISGRWCEIDNEYDYKVALSLFSD